MHEYQKLLGIGKYGKQYGNANQGGVDLQDDLLSQPESLLLNALLTLDYGKTIDNLRVQRMMGINRKDGKATTENIPSSLPDRSMFSCERYQFFLDAPFEISHQCCHVMKKEPLDRYAKQTGRKPMTAQMASESRLRTQVWLRNGCNAFDAKKQVSNPMAFWTEQDVLLYIYKYRDELISWRKKEYRKKWQNTQLGLTDDEIETFLDDITCPICGVYGEVVKENEVEGQLDLEDLGLFDLGRPTLKTTGCSRTGCMLCGFGCHLEKPGEGRFELLHQTHPKMYGLLDVVKNNGVTFREAIDWVNEHGNLNIRY